MGRSGFALLLVALVAAAGCRSTREASRPSFEAAPTNLPITTIDYVDSDAFDALFEASLVNRDPVITIRTQNQKPDWTGRLNGWIAAWNMGKTPENRRFRGQIPVPTIDAETLREFRLLIGAVVDRADDASRAGVLWFKEDRIRSRRVELLRPYNLRFHISEDGTIHVIFFCGDHARHYRQFVAELTDDASEETWTRTIEFSRCKRRSQAAQSRGTGQEPVPISTNREPTQ